MLILLLGDTHGNMNYLANTVLPYAQERGAQQIVQLGDFGFLWPGTHEPTTLRRLDQALDASDTDLLFLPGNHDFHPRLKHLADTSPLTTEGHHQISERVSYTGRMSAWTWGDVRFAAVGGAVSVDRGYRIMKGLGWWPQESLTEGEVVQATTMGQQAPVDVLLTHDCPTSHPFADLVPDFRVHDQVTEMHRQHMSRIGRALQPRYWWHGHYHWPATYGFQHRSGICRVSSLDCDGAPVRDSCAVIDTEDLVDPLR